ncbi:class I SAM-dependent methyltransferase [Cecembia rubra]|uniref:Methyltransferase family protein n=1 Tax=Cecembia rubra TaxID=1485585 RepID=A0A2P8ECW8_9BACT|nr:class I SAM-dependent methyltransferase [Cecembia rubra]PSL07284.1 methyltransferase family protein [Cecembia rubra]
MDSKFWDEKFSSSPDLYGELPNEFLKDQLYKLKKGKILLPGEGEGRNAFFAASNGWEVTALDQSQIAQKHTLEKAEKANLHIKYHVCNVEDYLPEAKSFDVIAMIYFHLPLTIRDKVHQRFVLALKENGLLILEGFGKPQLNFQSGGPKNLEMLYSLEELKSSFPNLNWQYEFDGPILLKEGKGHSGEAHVIRLIGKKQPSN